MPKVNFVRLSFAAAVTAVLLLGAPFAAQARQTIVIKFSHVTTADTPKGKGADKFKELAEKYTGGKVRIEIYPNSTLYKDKEEIEALQLGCANARTLDREICTVRRQGIRGARSA